MDKWTSWTEFFACGLLVLPALLGIGLDSFEAFAITLALLQIALIAVTLGSPTVATPARDERQRPRR